MNPSLGAVRALLAVIVIYYHAHSLLGLTDPLQRFGTNFGEIAVDNFFFLSGFLLIQKALILPFDVFMFRRIKRIIPGLFTFLMIICIGVLLLNLNDLFDVGTRDLFSWVYTNIDPINPNRMYEVNGAFSNNPRPMVLAGNLWTITFEFWCYIFLAISLAVWKSLKFFRSSASHLASILFLIVLGLHLLGTVQNWENNYSEFTKFVYHLLPLFLFGGVCSLVIDKFGRIPQGVIRSVIAILSLLIPFTVYLKMYSQVSSFLIAIFVLAVTSSRWLSGQKVLKYFRNHDIAFGIYLYSYPIQQLLWMLGLNSIYSNFLIATLISIFAGHISYVKIESKYIKVSSNSS